MVPLKADLVGLLLLGIFLLLLPVSQLMLSVKSGLLSDPVALAVAARVVVFDTGKVRAEEPGGGDELLNFKFGIGEEMVDEFRGNAKDEERLDMLKGGQGLFLSDVLLDEVLGGDCGGKSGGILLKYLARLLLLVIVAGALLEPLDLDCGGGKKLEIFMLFGMAFLEETLGALLDLTAEGATKVVVEAEEEGTTDPLEIFPFSFVGLDDRDDDRRI